mgnify:FL=1
MKLATTAKLPKKTSAKVNDQDNLAWTEDMLGAPVLKSGLGPQANPTKVLNSVRLEAETTLVGRPITTTRKRTAA